MLIDYFFIDSCVNAKKESLNHTYSRKGFLEKAWSSVSGTGWDQCTLADPTYMHGRFKSWKIPKSCEL